MRRAQYELAFFAEKVRNKQNILDKKSIMKTTFDEYLVFCAVVDSGSLTAAAERLDQTVSAVSRTLRRLEEKLRTNLLNRTTRRLSLTEEGQLFLTHARMVLDVVGSAEEAIEVRRRQPAGRLRINAASPFMTHVIVPLVSAFRNLYPQIELVLNTDDLNIDLLEENTDVAIRIGELGESTLRARPLGSSALRILASPAYLQRHGEPQSVEELMERHVLLGFSQPETLNDWPLPTASANRCRIFPTVSASSGETLRQLALEGVGVVCLSDFMTHRDRQRGDLVQLLQHQTVASLQPIYAVYYRNRQIAARVACFLDFLAERLVAMNWLARRMAG